MKKQQANLEEKRSKVKEVISEKLLPSILFFNRLKLRETREEQTKKHNKKFENLALDQERPLFNVSNTVKVCDESLVIPKYVMETLSLGPRNAVLEKFDPKKLLAEIDGLLSHCKKYKISDDIGTDINVKTLA